LIKIDTIDVSYGQIPALKAVSIAVAKGEIVTIIGANGAGKSTLFKAITGLLSINAGSVHFAGEDVTRLAPADMARRGLAVVPEGRRLFGPLSVFDNLRLGAYVRLIKRGADIQPELNAVFDLFPRLHERRDQAAGTLSGGEQQMLAIGRALMTKPLAILMDEPSIGLAPLIVRDIFRVIRDLKESGITVLLIEQNARMALKVADRAYVMELGHITEQGPAAELQESPSIRKRYLAA
jgi:branched-chain amino acid transport system ATP-binding protein|tara:strand:+ start:4152 stop:4862 length:711 start_codon:yes stop_codon:yes gene_type:complete